MKTIAMIIVCGVIFTLNLTGQNNKKPDLFNGFENDTITIAPYSDGHNSGRLFKKFDLPDNFIINHELSPGKKHFNMESPAIKHYNDKLLAEKFPGSDRFYAKRPYLISPNDKSFVKRPDMAAKYFLIIEDPITNKIIK